MKNRQLILMGLLLSGATGYSALIAEDFESYTVGGQPTATRVSATGDAENFIAVVGSGANSAGTGNGVEIKDNSSAGTGLEWEYGTAESAVKASFDFSAVSLPGSNSKFIAFGIGEDGVTSLASGAKRIAEARLYDAGRIRVYWNGSYVNAATVTAGTSHNLTMFANDFDSQAVDYTVGATTYTLAANSVAWWLDGSLILNGAAEYGDLDLTTPTDGGAGTIASTEGNLNRIGFTSSSSYTGLDYVFDNVGVEVIPEPATLGMIALVGGAMIVIRRRLII